VEKEKEIFLQKFDNAAKEIELMNKTFPKNLVLKLINAGCSAQPALIRIIKHNFMPLLRNYI